MHSIFGIDDFYKIKIYKNNKLLKESDIAIWPNGWDLHTTLKKHNIIKINKSELNKYEDYSEILLSHGGVLDRLDSFILAILGFGLYKMIK